MGYDLVRFEREDMIRELMPQLICTLCKDVFRKPMKIKECEHVLCHDCLDQRLNYRLPNCPICYVALPNEKPLLENDAFAEDRLAASMLDRLMMFCTYSKYT